MFPWAAFENDFTEDDEDDDLKYEYMDEFGISGENYIDWDDYSIWKEQRISSSENLRPYQNVAEEADFYKIKVSLNELGQSFLTLNKYLDSLNDFIR